jgi:SAM-dependent methyltransferase
MSEDFEQAFPANAAQAAYWNVDIADRWVENQARLDRLFEGITAALLESARPRPGERVLDVGCGTGATTLELAEAVGADGHVLGIDLSEPMLDVARRRVGAAGHRQIDLLRADAQSHRFAPGSVDLITSRFGVMFFSDPLAAFANLRTALRADGRLVFVCWTDVDANPWFARPLEVAVRHLGAPEKKDPRAPGPFALAERDYVSEILAGAGYKKIQVERLEVPSHLDLGVEETATFAVHMGPTARLIRERADDQDAVARAVAAEVADAFRPFVTEGGMRFPAVVSRVTVRNG